MDGPRQDHQSQNPELGGDQDPCRASDQDPHGATSRTGRRDLDPADVSEPQRDQTGANQEAAPESGGGVPSLLISGAAEQVPQSSGPRGPAGLRNGAEAACSDLLSLRGECLSLASETNVSRTSEDDDSASVAASSVTSLFHRVQLDPLEKAWMRSSALGDAAAQRRLLRQESSLATRKDFITGFTALHWAAKQGCQDAVDMMLRSGADVNVKSHGGYTPLHLAAIHGHQRLVHALIHVHNARTNIRDYHGKVAAHYWSGPAHVFEGIDLPPGGRSPGQRLVLPSLRLSRSRSHGQLGLHLSGAAGGATWDLQV